VFDVAAVQQYVAVGFEIAAAAVVVTAVNFEKHSNVPASWQ